MKVLEIEGVGTKYAGQLRTVGILTDADLLEKGATRKGRAELAEASGIPDRLILEWVNHADLMRIKGVGPEYADLLEEAGVDTVPELARRDPVHLHEAITALLLEKELVRRPPTEGMVADWVAEAKTLGRVIEY
jgi:predicted flap endonuclease-1-like 5' DNA nuclease